MVLSVAAVVGGGASEVGPPRPRWAEPGGLTRSRSMNQAERTRGARPLLASEQIHDRFAETVGRLR